MKIINGGRQKPSRICPKCYGNLQPNKKDIISKLMDRCVCNA
jgi:hypothetical protein